MPKKYCTICKKGTEVVFDHSAGETVCSVCSVGGDSEWGSFVDESNNEDCVIVHGPTNPLLIDGDDLSGDVPAEFLSGSLRMLQNRGPRHDKLLILALQMIEKMADRLDLAATIKDRAIEIYRKVKPLKMRGRKQDAVVAACIYIACRQDDKPRTIKEICTIANGPTKKEIGRAKEFIGKQLEVQTGTIHACDFVMRFCSNLGMNNDAVKAVQYAVKKSEDLDIRRSPTSIAACVIYMITQLSDDKKPLKDISFATSVCEGTIIITYKDLYPHAARLIPMSYAMIEDLKNLPRP